MTQSIGSSYQVTIPALSDTASIVDALKYYHQGGLTGSPATNSIEQYIINVNNRAGTIETAIGWPYSNGSSISARIASLESDIGSNLSATYVKSVPTSNNTAQTRNLINPTVPTVIPLQIKGAVGQEVDLQQWSTSAATVAKIDQTGKLFSHDGSSMAEVATISGTQTLTNKTLTSPIQTLAVNARVASYTLILSDQSKIVEMSSSSPMTLTIPSDSVAFPVGTFITVVQMGTGQVTVAGTGFTPLATPGLKLRTQYSMATLLKRGSNSWVVAGDLVA